MKSTKKSLLLSTLSLIMCVAMLLGTTYAWFTDSVTSGRNKIQAGNLDVELYHNDIKVTETTSDLFKVGVWEPGVIAYENFKVVNEGSLALKYAFSLNVFDKNTYNGKDLSEVIKAVVVDGGFNPTGTTSEEKRAEAQALEGYSSIADFQKNGHLDTKNASDTYGVVLYWEPTDNDNDYNVKNGAKTDDNKDALFIEFGVNLVATQYTYEADSFDHLYDADAIPGKKIADGLYQSEVNATAYTVTNANGLAKFNELYNTTDMGAVSLELAADIDMTGKTWTPIASLVGGEITPSNKITKIDGKGFKISNLTIGEHSVARTASGMIVSVANDLIVKDITFNAPKLTTTKSNVGAIVGEIIGGTTTFDNVIVNNADITADKKIGTLVGVVNDENNATHEKVVINNCSVAGSKFNNTNTEDSYTGTLVGWVADTLYGAEIEIKGTCNVSPAAVTYSELCTSIYNAKLYLHSYGPYVCVDELDNVMLPVATSAELAAAITSASAGDTIIVSSALSSETPITIPSFNKPVTIKGDGQTHFVAANDEYGSSAASLPEGVVFEDLIIDCGSALYHGFQHSGKITFKNCKITGEYHTYADTDFIGCELRNENAGKYVVQFYGGDNFNFTDCEFYGGNRNVYAYQEGLNATKTLKFTNCKFHQSLASSKSAVMLNAPASYNNGAVFKLIMDHCDIDTNIRDTSDHVKEPHEDYFGAFGLKHIKGGGTTPLQILGTVTIDDIEVYNSDTYLDW